MPVCGGSRWNDAWFAPEIPHSSKRFGWDTRSIGRQHKLERRRATIPAGALAWHPNGGTGAWTAFTAATAGAPLAPGASTVSHALQLTIPALQAPGAYSATVTYTAVVAP